MKSTKLFLTMAMAFLFSVSIYAQDTWMADKAHSKVTFSTVHNTISDVAGLFNSFEAQIVTSEENFSDASFEVEIDVNSIDTEVKMRDDHLRSADFFEVEKYPKMTFKSNSIKKADQKGHYKVMGDLTIKDVTKPVTLDLWYRGTIQNDQGKSIAGFQVTGTIDRIEYNIGTGFPNALISEEVTIKVDGEFIKE